MMCYTSVHEVFLSFSMLLHHTDSSESWFHLLISDTTESDLSVLKCNQWFELCYKPCGCFHKGMIVDFDNDTPASSRASLAWLDVVRGFSSLYFICLSWNCKGTGLTCPWNFFSQSVYCFWDSELKLKIYTSITSWLFDLLSTVVH